MIEVTLNPDPDALQRVLENAPDYFRRIRGEAPAPDEGQSLSAKLPPGKSLEHKLIYGLSENGEMFGVADVIRGFPGEEVARPELKLQSSNHLRASAASARSGAPGPAGHERLVWLPGGAFALSQGPRRAGPGLVAGGPARSAQSRLQAGILTCRQRLPALRPSPQRRGPRGQGGADRRGQSRRHRAGRGVTFSNTSLAD